MQEAIEGGVGYRRIGGLEMFDVPFGMRAGEIHAEVEARARVQQAKGIPTEVLDRREALEREPELAAGIAGALYCPDDGVGDHTFATRKLAAAAENAGAVIRTEAEVGAILHDRGSATGVRLASGEVVPVGDQLVILANRGAPELLRPLLRPHELAPLWPFMPQMLYVTNPERRTVNHLLGHKHRKLAIKQLPDGSMMLSGGWSVERDAGGRLTGSLSAVSLNLADAIATLPFLDRSAFDRVDASRVDTMALDRIPIIGRPDSVANMLYGYAWSGHGWAISLGFTRYLTEWLVTGEQPPALAPFAPTRFR